ncbi:ATP-dependent DNA helicase [Frankliniella fusca]|uniref:ATP-dependent DNA helicase n=1 Tax=Frankliniella fusca TaxID=407009 RepID=A0AAE1HJ46_9NEOP|nr:ATP-dependent DNA helicase [Frankliniella fusca]
MEMASEDNQEDSEATACQMQSDSATASPVVKQLCKIRTPDAKAFKRLTGAGVCASTPLSCVKSLFARSETHVRISNVPKLFLEVLHPVAVGALTNFSSKIAFHDHSLLVERFCESELAIKDEDQDEDDDCYGDATYLPEDDGEEDDDCLESSDSADRATGPKFKGCNGNQANGNINDDDLQSSVTDDPALGPKSYNSCEVNRANANVHDDDLQSSVTGDRAMGPKSHNSCDDNRANDVNTIGTVHDILFAPESDTPSVILCHFPSYNGPSLIPGSNLVPIKNILKPWTNDNGVNCTRYQFPITLCNACSIHKSQGMTLDKAKINIGEQDFSLGLSYVAFSGVRSLNYLLIEPFCVKRLERSHSVLATLEMKKDFLENI